MDSDKCEDKLEIAAEEADENFQASLRKSMREYELGKTIDLEDLKRIHKEETGSA